MVGRGRQVPGSIPQGRKRNMGAPWWALRPRDEQNRYTTPSSGSSSVEALTDITVVESREESRVLQRNRLRGIRVEVVEFFNGFPGVIA